MGFIIAWKKLSVWFLNSIHEQTSIVRHPSGNLVQQLTDRPLWEVDFAYPVFSEGCELTEDPGPPLLRPGRSTLRRFVRIVPRIRRVV